MSFVFTLFPSFCLPICLSVCQTSIYIYIYISTKRRASVKLLPSSNVNSTSGCRWHSRQCPLAACGALSNTEDGQTCPHASWSSLHVVITCSVCPFIGTNNPFHSIPSFYPHYNSYTNNCNPYFWTSLELNVISVCLQKVRPFIYLFSRHHKHKPFSMEVYHTYTTP